MKNFIFLLIALYSVTSIAAQTTYLDKWFVCQKKDDCIIVADFCSWRAINKKFEKTFRETEDQRANPYECIAARSDPETKNNYELACVNKICQKSEKINNKK